MFYSPRTRNSAFAWALRVTLFAFGFFVYLYSGTKYGEWLTYEPDISKVTFGYCWWLVVVGMLGIVTIIGALIAIFAIFATVIGLWRSMRSGRKAIIGVRMPKKKRPAHLRVIRDGSTKPWIPPMDYLDRQA